MRIIVLGDKPDTTRSVALPRAVLWLAPLMLVCCLLLAAIAGYRMAIAQAGKLPSDLVSAWGGELESLDSKASELKESSAREGRAYASRLAALQARLLRMEAVGQRLASAAKLDGGEFDFDQEPAFGGPYTSESAGDSAPTEFSLALDRLATQIENRETQLQVMERLLVNRELALDVAVDGWPVASGYVSSVFGRRTDPFSGRQAFHKGLDFTARPGTPVMAVASGVVTWAGWDKDYGKLIEVRHSDGYRSRYAHNSEILVKPGEVVMKGQKIAKVGATGRASGTHLHLEVLANGQLVDPRQYIGTRRAVR
jgi:murein DD-endopeptidase MepM/ murein hydrolase activator NlpD